MSYFIVFVVEAHQLRMFLSCLTSLTSDGDGGRVVLKTNINAIIVRLYYNHLHTHHVESVSVRPDKVLRIVPAHNRLTVKVVPRDAPEFTWIKR